MVDFIWWLIREWHVFGVEMRYWIGFLAAAACFAISAYAAKEVRSSPRLFTVMALFAGAWVAVTSIYELPPYLGQAGLVKDDTAFKLHDRAADLSSFIFVFVGAVLAREGREEHWFFNSEQLQVAALSLLFALVIPRQLPPEWISPKNAELVIAEALAVVGFLALGIGAAAVAKPKHFIWLTIILIAYSIGTLGRGLELFLFTPRRPLSDFLMLTFAVLKLSLTCVFCYIVLWHHRFGKP